MKTWKQAPLDQVIAQYVECYWLLEYEQGENNAIPPVLLPNPDAHLVITPADAIHHYRVKPNQAQPDQAQNRQAPSDRDQMCFIGSHLLMPSNRSIELLDTENVLRLGIKFHPGSPYRLWGLNGKQTLNGCFNQLEFVHPLLDSKQLTTLLALRGKPKDIAKKLDALIRTIASEGIAPNTSNEHHYSLVRKALCHLEGHGSDELEKQLSCSRRTLERAVMKVTGLTIKQHEMMKRLDLLFTYLYKHADKTLNWVDIALKFGFSDQPHLIRELKKYIGATPGSYLNTRNLIIDIYGDFESPPEMNNRYVKSKITALSLLFNIEQSDMVTMAKTKVNK